MLRMTMLCLLTFTVSCKEKTDRTNTEGNKSYVQVKDYPKNELNYRVDTAKFNVDKGNLTGKTITINVSYAAIECTCPQWFETKNMNDTINGRQYFYLERGNKSITNADTLYDGINPPQLTLTGQFYNKEGYPKNYNPSKGEPMPSRVFKYEKIKYNRIR
ncbi:MAG TPA: hypothetical protein PLO99_05815 [Chitinophagaceae bacterium]|nr:hypothetical protein [Chitinophagaceae bacterium]